ncbi:hypothetical protein B0H13DRAFT_1924828 [Mycena leptocephala]|nr:hypothetical protein B0H13DRAFT_1924828 [Mycena leptocephala]
MQGGGQHCLPRNAMATPTKYFSYLGWRRFSMIQRNVHQPVKDRQRPRLDGTNDYFAVPPLPSHIKDPNARHESMYVHEKTRGPPAVSYLLWVDNPSQIHGVKFIGVESPSSFEPNRPPEPRQPITREYWRGNYQKDSSADRQQVLSSKPDQVIYKLITYASSNFKLGCPAAVAGHSSRVFLSIYSSKFVFLPVACKFVCILRQDVRRQCTVSHGSVGLTVTDPIHKWPPGILAQLPQYIPSNPRKVYILAVPKKGGSWQANEALKVLQKRYTKFQEEGER